ncbi:tRNA uridine-5-carboxymethylaminomethyl(34) synthesis GTPase MnmE [Empedobacter stercoris]|uniref:tRNA modification GTPase MnmE n=2 Tax=Empedobacter TaxID=59734 RepID=A0ABY8V6Y6_9FLAO|nr:MULTISPECIES: tRNA uridine-5-carboxymethylaminomethyl(34) synthesis GTPase MnmE [Empedobacter]MCA4810350.1 tRNA uridine-5-carboxymethylaminomethyl(34) synthesis GTPase MnmE [Empedobacter stercoris]MDM1522449.1 tRNA uridine-5-carboxymethylaminomethyl(34) synthesis GTPase MnmE [Empedobacter sp. 225-1]MDM1542639.1 tRNA uridine-5-carboxymethylaminomethyl(34) synthesis GTPase MnmE [Empedobacter sp. 189-2]NOJ74829.1 tRNA uridine-5-carboxymethylaminomethyl(34) synthesis GTPase MnmE [Empedobacter st
MLNNDTICALATANGMGAIAVIRISGPEAISKVAQIYQSKFNATKSLNEASSHTIHLGYVMDGDTIVDEALFSIFKNPHSYTGEDVVEISTHGSIYIQQKVLELLNKIGIRNANPGEYTFRAFWNGKMDLTQAEAVADLIASDSKASHEIAIKQMRGGFSNQIKDLREQMINFAALMELELDFSEEDVEFADRSQFYNLLNQLQSILKRLADSFAFGNVIKNGVPVAIVGAPNAGKSTLLNALLNEERAIVSDIEGTTRDTIEETIYIDGVGFRFIDTAGIREAGDSIERIGIEKTFEKIDNATIIIYLYDANITADNQIANQLDDLQRRGKILFNVANKIDVNNNESSISDAIKQEFKDVVHLEISAKDHYNIEALKENLIHQIKLKGSNQDDTIVTNSRHLEALQNTLSQIGKIKQGMDMGLPGDLLAMDIREALTYLGHITGEIDVDQDILGTIFGKFCIGK